MDERSAQLVTSFIRVMLVSSFPSVPSSVDGGGATVRPRSLPAGRSPWGCGTGHGCRLPKEISARERANAERAISPVPFQLGVKRQGSYRGSYDMKKGRLLYRPNLGQSA